MLLSTHVVEKILLAEIIDLRSRFNTSGSATAHNEAE